MTYYEAQMHLLDAKTIYTTILSTYFRYESSKIVIYEYRKKLTGKFLSIILFLKGDFERVLKLLGYKYLKWPQGVTVLQLIPS